MFSGLEFVVLIEVLVASALVFMYFSRSLSSADAGKRRVLLAASVAVMFMLVAGAVLFSTQGYRVSVSFDTDDKYRGVIDAHEHYWLGGNMAYFVEAMNRTGIDKAVFVPTGFKPDNKGYKENMAALLELRKMYPSRIIVFCTIDEQDPDAPEIFEDCMRKGGKGLKLLGWHPNYADEPVNSTKMYRVYEKARQIKAPILIHINLQDYPEWKPQFEQVLKDFGDVHFIAAHYCKATQTSAELGICAELLDKYPNLDTDISMGGGLTRYQKFMKNDSRQFRDFIIKYQDRILWGADIILDKGKEKMPDWIEERIMCDFRMHREKSYKCAFSKLPEEEQPGLDLPEGVLKKIYVDNPKRVLKN